MVTDSSSSHSGEAERHHPGANGLQQLAAVFTGQKKQRARGRFFQDFEKGVLRLLGHILRLGEQEHPSGGLVGQNVGILPQRADGIDMEGTAAPSPPLRGYPDGNPPPLCGSLGRRRRVFRPLRYKRRPWPSAWPVCAARSRLALQRAGHEEAAPRRCRRRAALSPRYFRQT